MRKRFTEAGITREQLIDGTSGCNIWFYIDVAERECVMSVDEQADGSALVTMSSVDDLLIIPEDFYLLTNHHQTGANSCVFRSFFVKDKSVGILGGITLEEVLAQGLFEPIVSDDVNAMAVPFQNERTEVLPADTRVSAGVKVDYNTHQVKAPFLLTKNAMIATHKRNWPTIERDIKDASKNGLAAAKPFNRKWNEKLALQWARANNKLIDRSSGSLLLQQTIRNIHDGQKS